MTEAQDVPSPEEQTYAMYKALIDPMDEAILRSQEAEGQPVGHLWEERRRELEELRPLLGLGDQVADVEAER